MLLSCFVLLPAASVLVQVAGARADFSTFVNRATRPAEPLYYDINGTSTERMVSWPGVKGVGNLGIGDGNVSLMEPEFINDAMKSFNEDLTKNETAAENTTGDLIAAPQNNSKGNGTLVSPDVAAGNDTAVANGNNGNVTPEPGETESLTESLLPNYLMAAGVSTRAEPYSITINQPFPHILNEDPVEAGVLYAKMFGLPLPDGRMMDIGIKSLGSEF